VEADIRGKVVAVQVEANGNDKELEYFGVTAEQLPCVYLARMPDDQGGAMKKYKGPTAADFSAGGAEAALVGLYDKYFAGELQPHRKSEPAPEPARDAHGVVTVVGDSIDALVADGSKDLLIEFYAPWCGHCKQLAPIYDQLATEFSSVDSVVIAKMDATSNDAPEDLSINGFPSIKFWKAGASRVPIDYDGERTVKGFRKFLKAKAGVPFTLPKKQKPRKAEL